MTTLHVQQVATGVRSRYTGLIDLSDEPTDPAMALLTRGLAALAIQVITGEEPATTAACVIDGMDDQGIDAVYVDETTPRLVLVQSKWRSTGAGFFNQAEALKFVAGMRSLTEERYQRFNPRLQAIAAQIGSTLRRPGAGIELVVVTTSNDGMGTAAQQVFDDACRDMNEPGEILTVRLLRLADVHRYLVESASTATIELTVPLYDWGAVEEPHQAVYGTVDVRVVAEWHERFGDRLFERNIRKALGATAVNQRLVTTLADQSENFWYFNNGITVLCQEIRKAPLRAAHRQYGEFVVSGVSVVNGAQTVASISEAIRRHPESAQRARVWVRVISLETCPENFGDEVTRSTNTQNRVVDRDFVALDPTQERLRVDFSLSLGKTYTIKRGEPDPDPGEGCSLEEATIALACAQPDPRFAVLARSKPGVLWDTGPGGGYAALFGQSTPTAAAVWRWVQALREVDDALDVINSGRQDRNRGVARNGDRLIAHLVFGMLDHTGITDATADWSDQLGRVAELTSLVTDRVAAQVAKEFPQSYLTSLFRNITKCRELAALVRADLAAGIALPPPQPTDPDEPPVTSIEFFLTGRGASARGFLSGGGVVVAAGSLAATTAVPSLAGNPSATNRRRWLLGQGALRPSSAHPGTLELTRDELFDSPSQASSVMLGRPSNGRYEWRTATGESINEVLGGL